MADRDPHRSPPPKRLRAESEEAVCEHESPSGEEYVAEDIFDTVDGQRISVLDAECFVPSITVFSWNAAKFAQDVLPEDRIIRCPGVNCKVLFQTGCQIPVGIKCPICSVSFCIQCLKTYHAPAKCTEFQAWSDLTEQEATSDEYLKLLKKQWQDHIFSQEADDHVRKEADSKFKSGRITAQDDYSVSCALNEISTFHKVMQNSMIHVFTMTAGPKKEKFETKMKIGEETIKELFSLVENVKNDSWKEIEELTQKAIIRHQELIKYVRED